MLTPSEERTSPVVIDDNINDGKSMQKSMTVNTIEKLLL